MLLPNDNKIKVCVISAFSYFLFDKKYQKAFGGGATIQLYILSKELAKNSNFLVNIISGDYNIKKERTKYFEKIKIHITQPLDKRFINHIRRPVKLFLTLKRIKPDVVVQRAAGLITGLCALYCKLYKKKFIYSIANQPDVNGEAERGISGKFYKYGLDNASYIVAQNKEQILELERYKKRKLKNIKVIKSGYDVKKIDLTQKKYVLWVARAIDWKRPELFLKLSQKFPNEKFVIICNKLAYDDFYWETIFNKASKISNLEFLEFVPFHEIDKYFQEAKILVNTSTYEGFPNTFIQAFKNKTPVISLNVDPDNLLTKNKIGFFCNNDFDKMVEYMRLLLENNDLYKTYAKNVYFYAKKHHDIKTISEEWMQLIKKLANK